MLCSLLYASIFALFSNHATDLDWYEDELLNSVPLCNAMEEIKTNVGDGAASGDRVTGAFVGTGALVGDEVVVVTETVGVELAEIAVVAGLDVTAKMFVGTVLEGAAVGPSVDPSGAADLVNGATAGLFVDRSGAVVPLKVGDGAFVCDGDGCLGCRVGEVVVGVGGVEGGRVVEFVTTVDVAVPVPPFTPFLLFVDFVPKYTPNPAPPATNRNKKTTKSSIFRFLLLAS